MRIALASILILIVGCLAFFNIPVFAGSSPQAIIVQHCGKEVMFIDINNGTFNVSTPEVIQSRKDVYDFFAEIMHTGSIIVFKVEERSGIKCPMTA